MIYNVIPNMESTGTPGTYIDASSFQITTNNNITASFVHSKDEKSSPNPELIFSFVKSKMTKTQQQALLHRIERIRHIMQTCLETGQKALADEMLLELAGSLHLQEMASFGYDTLILKSDIDKYVKAFDSKVAFDLLDKFPRPIPPEVRKVIAKVKKLNLFRELWVLYHNPDKKELKSTLDKIVAKDPILFGKGPFQDRFFYITDWMDEACDLTLDGLIKHLRLADPSFVPGKVDPISVSEAEEIKARAQTKLDSLESTNRGTWKTEATLEHLRSKKLSFKEQFSILKAMFSQKGK